MVGSEHFTRLAASLVAAGLMGAIIANPDGGRRYVAKAALLSADPAPLAMRACESGKPVLKGPFAPLDDILSISPLGEVTAPGEQLPAPAIRLNTRKGRSAFERRTTDVLAPAKADIVAIERRTIRDAEGRAARVAWTLRLSICETVSLAYDDLDEIDKNLLVRAGGLKSFHEIGGPDHLAAVTAIRVRQGETLARADGFDIILEDRAAAPAALERPERYQSNPYAEGAAIAAPPEILKAIAIDASRIQCPLDYLPEGMSRAWKGKLGDAWGVRRARGENACRAALVDAPGTAQGAWFTDASHNGRTSKVSAVALAPDAIDPERMIFALHGRLVSLNAEMVGLNPMLEEARQEAARDFLTFEQGEGRINQPFDKVKPGETYCYEGLRANFVGPRINAVILLSIEANDAAPIMRIEAIGQAQRCIDLIEPWSFTGAETTFYR